MEKEETINNFIYLFPEWLMCSALTMSIKENNLLWKNLPFHFIESTAPKNLFEKYPLLKNAEFKSEQSFVKNENKKWGIEENDYRSKYWSLRPDFMIIDDSFKFLFLIEVKGGPLFQKKYWENPKEIRYFNFLKDAKNYNEKGFLYIIPKQYEDQCKHCLKSIFKDSNGIIIGYGIWEEMLEFISNSINVVFIDWLVAQSKGINILSQWKKEHSL